MPGAPDPLYIAARRALLDALEAVSDHLDAAPLEDPAMIAAAAAALTRDLITEIETPGR